MYFTKTDLNSIFTGLNTSKSFSSDPFNCIYVLRELKKIKHI